MNHYSTSSVYDIQGYADLIKLAQPDFIEVKAFTYPGPTSSIKEAGLSIQNCPSGPAIITFGNQLAEALNSRGGVHRSWELASVHIHSNSALLAASEFKSDDDGGGWNTWIDFDAFHNLTTHTEKPSIEELREQTDEMSEQKKSDEIFANRLVSLYTRPSPTWTSPTSMLGGFDPKFDSAKWMTQLANRRQHESSDQ